MCTAATYKTEDFYFGRTLDYECSYGEEIVIMPRNFRLQFLNMGVMTSVVMLEIITLFIKNVGNP